MRNRHAISTMLCALVLAAGLWSCTKTRDHSNLLDPSGPPDRFNWTGTFARSICGGTETWTIVQTGASFSGTVYYNTSGCLWVVSSGSGPVTGTLTGSTWNITAYVPLVQGCAYNAVGTAPDNSNTVINFSAPSYVAACNSGPAYTLTFTKQ